MERRHRRHGGSQPFSSQHTLPSVTQADSEGNGTGISQTFWGGGGRHPLKRPQGDQKAARKSAHECHGCSWSHASHQQVFPAGPLHMTEATMTRAPDQQEGERLDMVPIFSFSFPHNPTLNRAGQQALGKLLCLSLSTHPHYPPSLPVSLPFCVWLHLSLSDSGSVSLARSPIMRVSLQTRAWMLEMRGKTAPACGLL